MASTGDQREGITSLLDTDLYKLTMQCAVLKYFPDVQVEYKFTNRTPHMRLNRAAYNWLRNQIDKLEHVAMTDEEIAWLHKSCPYLTAEYIDFLRTFKLYPKEQVKTTFSPVGDEEVDSQSGDVSLTIQGTWKETIWYEIPLLALTSEAYFKFAERDWTHDGQLEQARKKGLRLLEEGCVFSEFGSRRRRDYKTHNLIMQGLIAAREEAKGKGWGGVLSGTSNAHLAMKYGLPPIGTVAHEWFMGIAAVTGDYANANEHGLQYWVGTFGRGVLAIALTDTFGTPAFLRAFAKPAPSSGHTSDAQRGNPTYAEIFTGVRQDSGDPKDFVKLMRQFYDEQGITDKKTIVFSDSLNVENSIEYKHVTEAAGLTASFGIGTCFTNDFWHTKVDKKSVPLNIVIKVSKANGNPAIKLSDDVGKNMGDDELVRKVKEQVRYEDKRWLGGNEAHRWDQ